MSKLHAPSVAAAAIVAVGAVGGVYYIYKIYKNRTRLPLPEEWTEVGTLKDLYVYPVKSCGPVLKNTAECTILGLKDGWLRDRVLMVTDEKDNFVTARVFPELLLVKPSLNGPILTLKHPDMEEISLNLAEVIGLQIKKKASVWGVTVPVYYCGFDVNNWFSRLLTKSDNSHRLVYYASQSSRNYRAGYTSNKLFKKWRKEDTGAFPDEVPYHIINEASIEELNSRIKDTPITHNYFRPNFVIEGPEAYAEDKWNFIKIGENVFEVIKPCTRCVMTVIDPETGIRNANSQPLNMLKTYRQVEDPEERRAAGTSPRMGLQIALRSGPGGLVNKGDRIYVA